MLQHVWKYLVIFASLALCAQMCSQQQPLYSFSHPAHPPVVGEGTFRAYPLPTSLSFAGEPVPLHIPDVAERLDRELLINSHFHSGTLLALKRMQRHMPEIGRILRENDIPEDFKYLAMAESLLANVTSSAGASGFWQLMPDTARGLGLIVNEEVDERYHAQKATVAACRYLKTAHKKFNGSWTNAAAAYNRGMGGIDRALKHQGVESYYDLYLNDETTRYMFRILALKEVLGNPQKYGYDFGPEHGYNPLSTRAYPVTSSIPDLPKFALDQGTNYKTLRLLNPWIKGYKLTVASGKQFELRLPE
ncbi:lytic transglycosylase domain-containing protein [soil metagenome]